MLIEHFQKWSLLTMCFLLMISLRSLYDTNTNFMDLIIDGFLSQATLPPTHVHIG